MQQRKTWREEQESMEPFMKQQDQDCFGLARGLLLEDREKQKLPRGSNNLPVKAIVHTVGPKINSQLCSNSATKIPEG